MSQSARVLQSNLNGGELSPRLFSRPDLEAYFNGLAEAENFFLWPQGGAYFSPGIRFVAEAKIPADGNSHPVRIVRYAFNRSQAYIFELGNIYIRFYRDHAPITQTAQNITGITKANPAVVTYSGADTYANGDRVMIKGVVGMVEVNNREFQVANVNAGANTFELLAINSAAYTTYVSGGTIAEIYEIVSPYLEADLFDLHFTTENDVIYITHQSYAPRKLVRVADTSWTLSSINFEPPPSYEKDADVSGGTITLTPAATTGTAVVFTASAAVFLVGDQGRQIVYGAGLAAITTFTDSTHVTCEIIDAFPDTNPIAAGSWFLRLSPQTGLDFDKKEPVGAQATGTTLAAFRAADVGKFIKVWGGLIKITQVTGGGTGVVGTIMSVLSRSTNANPPSADPGTWSLEVPSWSATEGYPKTSTLEGGRLYLAATPNKPKTIWGSSLSGGYENFAVGALASDAVEYALGTNEANAIQWLSPYKGLFIGTAATEHRLKGPGLDQPLGGDVIPYNDDLGAEGSAGQQVISLGAKKLYLQAARRKLMDIFYDFDTDSYQSEDRTEFAEHISDPGIKVGTLCHWKEPNSIVVAVRDDGELVCMTYRSKQKVSGWTRRTTDGVFESAAVIPHPDMDRDDLWVVVKLTVNDNVKRYIGYFDTKADEGLTRSWKELYTDQALVYKGSAATVISGLWHLIGKTVAVVADSWYVGTKVVSATGTVTLEAAATEVEIGLPLTGTIQTMPLNPQGGVSNGVFKRWVVAFVSLLQSFGGKVNGDILRYEQAGLLAADSVVPVTDEIGVTVLNSSDRIGQLTIEQHRPYPFKVKAVYGEVEMSEHLS